MTRTLRNEKGMALILVLLIAIAVSALAMGGIVMASAGSLTSKFHYRELALTSSAEGGIELARDSLNRNSTLLPGSGFVTLQSAGAVLDASGAVIPGYTRSVYVGRTGGRTGGAATSGQYGSNYASALSVIQDTRGAVAVRRMLLSEESWSRFAYAMNNWSNSSVSFGCGAVLVGPVHSNGNIYLSCSSGTKTLFKGPATVSGIFSVLANGNFPAGYAQNVQPVNWPTASNLAQLRTYAQDAGADYDIDATASAPTSVTPTTRIEFATVDLNNNGTIESNEGFYKVFQANVFQDTVAAYVSAKRWPRDETGALHANVYTDADPNMVSKNCGAVSLLNGGGGSLFRTASAVYGGTTGTTAQKIAAVQALLTSASRRCFLGGDPRLFALVAGIGDTLTPDSTYTYANTVVNSVGMKGKWLKRSVSLPVPPALATIRPGDQQYFFPLQSNVNFKGVIYVRGPVAVSGRLRGRVTVAATGKIMLADDLQYSVAPGTDCTETGDMLGITTPEDVPIEDNNMQNPFRVAGTVIGGFDDTSDNDTYEMFIFTLKEFWGEDVSASTGTAYNAGSLPSEYCAANITAKSACVRINGGIIRSDVTTPTYSPNVSGWTQQNTYDICGLSSPPPYFPTTGRYIQNRLYELDPVWLNRIGVATYFTMLQSQ